MQESVCSSENSLLYILQESDGRRDQLTGKYSEIMISVFFKIDGIVSILVEFQLYKADDFLCGQMGGGRDHFIKLFSQLVGQR